MAEVLAGLLTSAIVGIAKDKLASTIANKANLFWNFDDDLEDMEEKLKTISAALQDAEKRSANDKLVQLWLKRLKKAALDISDTLEDYQDTSEKVPGVFSCLPITLNKIDVASRMKSIREELSEISKEFRDFKFSDGSGTTISIEQVDVRRETLSLLPEDPVIGRNVEKQEIIKKLFRSSNNDETVVVAVHGLGGMSKSTLAQLVYNDDQFKKHDHRIWVYVSRDFSLKKIGNSIISQILKEVQQNRDPLQVINQCLDSLLCGKKVLIVLDDLWEENDTELRKLRSMLHVGKMGSMIDVIVTTRSEVIARKVSTCEAYMLLPLNHVTCWEIIKRTSNFEQEHNQQGFKQIGLAIAKKCGGVPLAAQAVGCLLQSKQLSEWIEINNSDIWNEYSEDGVSVLPSLKLTYERMPPQLKICFSYCAIFKKGHNIAEDDLIQQWTALDFIKPSMGKKYIRQLLEMSFLQVSKLTSNFGEAQYTMHDLLHDLARLIMADELIDSDVLSKSNNKHGQKYCRYALVKKYDQVQASKLSCLLPSNVRALHFLDCNELDLSSGAFSFAKCLRILDFSGCSSIQLPASIGKLKQLRYLLAPRMQNEVLPEYISELAKLKYLNLQGPSAISALPESIGKLSGCLEFLDLSASYGISKLPASIGDLKCLMHLDMSWCHAINELPDSLGNLTNLQHLKLLSCCSLKAIPESMCGLTQLQYLNLQYCEGIVRLPEAIGSLVDLQYLNLSGCGIRELPESFKGLGNLLHLDLGCSSIEKGLPRALHGLTTLQYLGMSWAQVENLEKDELPDAIRNLTNLKVLDLTSSLHRMFNFIKNDGYPDFISTLTNLEHLDLSCNAMLRYLPESIGTFKRLHTLNLKYCSSLKSLPKSIIGATRLKSLMLEGCSHRVIDQASSLLHYSLTLPHFMVRADDVSGHSNLHLLQGETDIDELHILSLENVGFLEEAQRLELSAKQNMQKLTLSWIEDAKRLVEDNDLLGELVPPMSLKDLSLEGYSSPSFPSWLMAISHHLPYLTRISLCSLVKCSDLPPLGQLPCLECLSLSYSPCVTKIDSGICGGKGAFPQLKYVHIEFMDGLEEWTTTNTGEAGVEEFMFPMLEDFYIESCPRLRFKPCLPNINSFTIKSSDQIISSVEDAETSGQYRCNSTPTNSLATRLIIQDSEHHSFRMFHHFPALQFLDFNQCPNLTSLPESIKQLSSLQDLALIHCDSMSALPDWLSDISSLKTLYIYGCTSIKSLPQCIQELTNLQKLHIGRNQELRQWCESEENKAKLAHIGDKEICGTDDDGYDDTNDGCSDTDNDDDDACGVNSARLPRERHERSSHINTD